MKQFTIPVLSDFDFDHTVRSYGFYSMAPNRYDKVSQTFRRPLVLPGEGSSKVVNVTLSYVPIGELPTSSSPYLEVLCDADISDHEKSELERQIVRMLRVDADYIPHFHSLFPPAKELGFGRMFRSPTIFEDFVKTMTNTNTTYKRTQRMNQLLCENVGSEGAFPTPLQLATFGEERLAEVCSVGYRAHRLALFAQEVLDNKIDLQWFETSALEMKTTKLSIDAKLEWRDKIKKKLLAIHGFGEFSANNLLQILGIFEVIPSDTETARLLREQYSVNVKNPKEIAVCVQNIFSEYAPFQYLVYWYKLYKDHMSSREVCFVEENVYITPGQDSVLEKKRKGAICSCVGEENCENGANIKTKTKQHTTTTKTDKRKKKKTENITVSTFTENTTTIVTRRVIPLSSRRKQKKM